MPCFLQPVFDFVGNRLNLPRIGAAAHHEVVGERAGALFEFHDRDFFGFFVLAGLDGFRDLSFQIALLRHE